MTDDAETRLLALARAQRAAADEAQRRRDRATQDAEAARRQADAARAAEERRIQERVLADQTAFLELMRRAGNPGLGRYPGRVGFSQTRGWKFGEHLLDRKGRWWRFRAAPSPTGGPGRHYAERLATAPPTSSEAFADMLAHYRVV